MHSNFLGDSYDLVKRFWADSLGDIAPLYAHPTFVPVDLRDQYSKLTNIQILVPHRLPSAKFGLLLDPDTGIPLPGHVHRKEHASLPSIVELSKQIQPAYMICFDQSHYRVAGFSKTQQMEEKRKFLQAEGITSFHYVSHAHFLFMAQDVEVLAAVRARLMLCGIPHNRFEP